MTGTPGIKGNPGHFAMKFINLRHPGSRPVFVVLPTENRKYTFYINSVKVAILIKRFPFKMLQHILMNFSSYVL